MSKPYPIALLANVIEALKPGGIPSCWNVHSPCSRERSVTTARSAYALIHYQVELAPADFFTRREMEVVRFVAERPARD
jgi:hypothetical protein